jgi:hypothetical protein
MMAFASSILDAQTAMPSIDVSPCSNNTPHISFGELTKRIVMPNRSRYNGVPVGFAIDPRSVSGRFSFQTQSIK